MMPQIRETNPQDDAIIAKHLRQIAQDLGTPADVIKSDWLDISLQFVSYARQKLSYKGFIAEVDGLIVGSASCQLYTKPYPTIWTEDFTKYGYIWGVYVEPSYRRQGIGKQLTNHTVTYLKSLNCTRIFIHASPFGKPVYESLGFKDSNEMYLDLKQE